MDGLTLLQEASAAGLMVLADGDRLVIRGPRSADAVARRLLAHKAVILAALAAGNGNTNPAIPEVAPIPEVVPIRRSTAPRPGLPEVRELGGMDRPIGRSALRYLRSRHPQQGAAIGGSGGPVAATSPTTETDFTG